LPYTLVERVFPSGDSIPEWGKRQAEVAGGIAMGRLLLPVIVAALVAAVFAGPAGAQNAPAPASAAKTAPAAPGQWPSIKGLKPYSDDTNGMSLSGFLRFLTFQQTGRWISNDDADRVVKQQLSK